MIYLVSKNQRLFESEIYKQLSIEDALNEIESWPLSQFDTETDGLDPHICKVLCAQFGYKKKNIQIVVDTLTIPLVLFKHILETKLIIGHNLKFDAKICFKFGIILWNVWDTMVVEQTTHLGFNPAFFKYSLKEVCLRYLNINIDKTVREEIAVRGLDEIVINYAAGDVVYLEDIRDKQIELCERQNCLTAALLENRFVVVIAYLEWSGIHLDEDKWKIKMQENETKKENALKALNDWVVNKYLQMGGDPKKMIMRERVLLCKQEFGKDFQMFELPKNSIIIGEPEKDYGNTYVTVEYPWDYVTINTQGDLFSGFDDKPKCAINWDSPKQVIPFMEYLGFNVETTDKKTNKKKKSIEDKILNKQKGIADDFLKIYLEYKAAAKECSTYGQNYLDAVNPITDRIHTSFKQLGAASGRMSCGSNKPNTDLANLKHLKPSCCKYVQLQNLPADDITRSAFCAMKGNLFTSCDYSALESRLGADIYDEPEMLNEFLHGSGDMHSLCAKLVFHEELAGIDVKDVKKMRPDLRKKVKPIEFSQQFGGGPRAVADALGCSKDEAIKFVRAYANGFKGISRFKAIGSKFVRTHGYIVICKATGHKLYWQDFNKWREMEDMPRDLMKREYTKKEIEEHDGAAAKWDRLALNVVTQGSGIIILKLAMISYFKWICDNGYFNKILICDLVHDEACIEYPKELLGIADVKLKEAMEKAAAKICKKLPIPAEAETGDFWIH